MNMHRPPTHRKSLLLVIAAIALAMGLSISRIKCCVPGQSALRPVETTIGLAIPGLPEYDFGQDAPVGSPLTNSSREDVCAAISGLSTYHSAVADLIFHASARAAIPHRLHARLMRSCHRSAAEEPLVA